MLRLYGVKRNDTNTSITEILRQVLKDGIRLGDQKAQDIVSSALMSIRRVDGGKCILFQLNRADFISDIFRNIGNLKNYQNPWNSSSRISISKNLSDSDNRARKQAMAVKDLLKARQLNVKIRGHVMLSVNGGEFKHFTDYMTPELRPSAKKSRLDPNPSTSAM